MGAVTEKENILKEIEEENAIIAKYNRAYMSNKDEGEVEFSYPHENYPETGSCILTFNHSQTVANIIQNH